MSLSWHRIEMVCSHRSLTEIAKIITGSKWSGPVFFGQKRKVRRTIW